MTCPKCQTENQEQTQFCINCGAFLFQSSSPIQTAPLTPPPQETVTPVIPKQVEIPTPPTIHSTIPSQFSKKRLLLFAGFGLVFIAILSSGALSLIRVRQERIPELGRESDSAPVTPVTEKFGGPTPFETQKSQGSLEFSGEDLSKLGVVSLPEGASVQFTYKGVVFMRSPQRSFSEQEIWLLKYFLDLTPQKLLNPPPKAVVTYAKGELKFGTGGFKPNAVAYASGPYIFFSEKSFIHKGLIGFLSDDSIDAVFRTFEHELVHVAQFFAVPDSAKQKMINGKIASKNKLYYSELLPNFIEVAGWQDTKPEENWFLWELSENEQSQKTTRYGKTNPVEDMADTIAGCILTDYEGFSEPRIVWCKEFLGSDAPRIGDSKLPIYPESQLVKSIVGRISDKEIEERYKQEFPLVDIQTWEVKKKNQIENVKNFFETELRQRGWQGSFSKEITKYGVTKYTGDFENSYRKINIQLKTYDTSDEYASAAGGTTIAVISGYK